MIVLAIAGINVALIASFTRLHRTKGMSQWVGYEKTYTHGCIVAVWWSLRGTAQKTFGSFPLKIHLCQDWQIRGRCSAQSQHFKSTVLHNHVELLAANFKHHQIAFMLKSHLESFLLFSLSPTCSIVQCWNEIQRSLRNAIRVWPSD